MLVVGMYTEGEIDPAIVLNVLHSFKGVTWDLLSEHDTSAFCSFQLLREGTFSIFDDDEDGQLNDGLAWVNENVRFTEIGDDYEVKLALTAGTYANDGSHPAENVFADIDTLPQWGWLQSGVGSLTFTGFLTVREKADTSNQAVATVTIESTVT